MTGPLYVAFFEDEACLLRGIRAVREEGLLVHDAYTPYAVHGMEEALALPPSRLTFVCFAAGVLGLGAALALQHYASVVSWPLNVGGKPFNSFPAFIPVAFELLVLTAGLVTVAAFFLRSRLWPRLSSTALPGVTCDRFALALDVGHGRFDRVSVDALLSAHGATDSQVLEVDR
jgi:hypothetical protein